MVTFVRPILVHEISEGYIIATFPEERNYKHMFKIQVTNPEDINKFQIGEVKRVTMHLKSQEDFSVRLEIHSLGHRWYGI